MTSCQFLPCYALTASSHVLSSSCEWTGGFNHFWLNFLARRFPGSTIKAVGSKLALNQAFANPLLYLPGVYVWNGKLYHQSSNQEIAEKFQNEYANCVLRMWVLWIPSNVVMFALVPAPMQVPFISVVNLIWNTSLSLIYNSSNSSQSLAPSDEAIKGAPT